MEDEPKLVDQKIRTFKGEFKGTCYRCVKEGHRSYECLEKVGDRITVMVNDIEDSFIEPKWRKFDGLVSTIW